MEAKMDIIRKNEIDPSIGVIIKKENGSENLFNDLAIESEEYEANVNNLVVKQEVKIEIPFPSVSKTPWEAGNAGKFSEKTSSTYDGENGMNHIQEVNLKDYIADREEKRGVVVKAEHIEIKKELIQEVDCSTKWKSKDYIADREENKGGVVVKTEHIEIKNELIQEVDCSTTWKSKDYIADREENRGGVVVKTEHIEIKNELIEVDCSTKSKSNVPLRYECKYCFDRFPGRLRLKAHVKVVHDRNYSCKYCILSFRCKAEHLRHFNETHKPPKLYKCAQCEEVFDRIVGLQIHLRLDHKRRREYFCRDCRVRFTTKLLLDFHTRKHPKERFTCNFCGKDFVSFSCLVSHIRRHLGEPPFWCKRCDKFFTTSDAKASHNAALHCTQSS